MRRGALLVTGLLCLTLFSCQLFESDVADFMETYTETANIEEHSIKTTNYKDIAKHIRIDILAIGCNSIIQMPFPLVEEGK